MAELRPSVLVTEDEALVSLDLCGALQDGGYHVIGPADTLEAAMFLVEWQRPRAAIVDFMLKGHRCALLMLHLRRAGVPFLVHSGDPQTDELITLCQGAPWLSKPVAPSALIEALGRLLRQGVPA